MDQLFVLSERLGSWPRWKRFGGATALTLSALLGHIWLRGDLQSYQLLFFFPAVTVSTLLFGEENGIWSVAFSAALAAYFLFEPGGFAISEPDEALALVLFIAVALFVSWTVGAMRRSVTTFIVEVTQAHSATERLERAVEERDLLLHEMAHRMKNDLQGIAAMLQIQGRAVTPEQGGAALLAAADRVRIMGRVQERLLTGSGRCRGSLDVASLVRDLCSDLQISLVGLRPISLKVEAETIELPVNDAVAVGLIINELVTNALKYAFPSDRAGTVRVQLTIVGESIGLVVEDDGVGSMPAAKVEGTEGLGRRLVRALAKQLEGTIETTSNDGGTRCSMRFPRPSRAG